MWVGFHSCSLFTSSWNHLGKLTGGDFPDGSVVKKCVCNAGDMGSIPGSGRSPREENDYPLHYFCSGNSMDRGVWQFIVHGVTKCWTQLQRLNMHTQALSSFCWPQLADLYWILTLYFGKWKCCSIGLQMVQNLAFGKMTRVRGFHCNCWFTDCRKKSSFTFQAL